MSWLEKSFFGSISVAEAGEATGIMLLSPALSIRTASDDDIVTPELNSWLASLLLKYILK
jgi:hypothetical protein